MNVLPVQAAPRLLADLERFAFSIRQAVGARDADPAQAERWLEVLKRLEQERHVIAAAIEHGAEGQPMLVRHASGLRFLARDTDGYLLKFAGDGFAREIETHRQLLVLTACQVFAAASGSGASGL